MKTTRIAPLATLAFLLAACATEVPTYDPEQDLGLLWVKYSADYKAVTRQIYHNAEQALPRMIGDKSWTALPGQTDAGDLPTAVVLDIDETVVSNIDFQISHERPFTNRKLEMWGRENPAQPIPGAVDFVEAARAAGVTVFFLTNRPCEKYADEEDLCPQKQTVIDNLRELGIQVSPKFVSLSHEQPDWTREKLVRRQLIAKDYRIIMIIGDDLADFVPCARKKVVAPCTEPGTRASRAAALEQHADYWGNGWYILPGPTHGSWTSVR
jgi:acid phosphatase